ncbi:MAG: hypothetical protein ACLFNK_05560 [Candidatus Woesearchaeota archaeon]
MSIDEILEDGKRLTRIRDKAMGTLDNLGMMRSCKAKEEILVDRLKYNADLLRSLIDKYDKKAHAPTTIFDELKSYAESILPEDKVEYIFHEKEDLREVMERY